MELVHSQEESQKPVKKEPFFQERWKPAFRFGLYLIEGRRLFNFFGLIMYFGKREGQDLIYGYSLRHNCLQFFWGPSSRNFFMPWDMVRYKVNVADCEGAWVTLVPEKMPHFTKALSRGIFKDDRLMFEAPYYYFKKDKSIQKTVAQFYWTTSFWRWRIGFGPQKITREINVTFKNEVGEGVGTVTGGVRHTTFECDGDEHPMKALNRMNRTKKF